jgi:hypothetical protein
VPPASQSIEAAFPAAGTIIAPAVPVPSPQPLPRHPNPARVPQPPSQHARSRDIPGRRRRDRPGQAGLPGSPTSSRASSMTRPGPDAGSPAGPAPGRRVTSGPLRRPPGGGGHVMSLPFRSSAATRRGSCRPRPGPCDGNPAGTGNPSAVDVRPEAEPPQSPAHGDQGPALPPRMSLVFPSARSSLQRGLPFSAGIR